MDNMEVIDERIIDIGLNALGYIAAGLLWTVVYSALAGRKKRAAIESSAIAATAGKQDAPAAEEPVEGKHKIEFVSFGRTRKETPAVQTDRTSSPTAEPTDRRRNRAEIIRMARQMIDEGASGEKIKQSLPIGDGELALLNGQTR
jgi:hypothetical protein